MVFDLSGGIDPSKELVLAERPQIANFRDAVNVWIESSNYQVAMRIGVEAVTEEWDAHDTWLDIAFSNGRVLSRRGNNPTHPALDETGQPTIRGAGPMKFQCIKPFERWTVSFNGTASETSAENLIWQKSPADARDVDVEFSLDMSMAAPPWIPGSLRKEAAEAMGGKQGDYMSPRYEQLFRVTGTLKVEDQLIDLSGCGLRIRRQGVRELQGFWGHCWQSAVFPSGKAFGYCIYPPRSPDDNNYNEGFIFDGNKRLAAKAVQVPWLRKLVVSGEDVPFVLETEDGKQFAISGTTFINTRSLGHASLPADFPIVQQAHAKYIWDGEETSGMIERSSLPDLVSFPDQ